jgi:catechol 2,3-dioxygenase-like lactoylglutathione lyase family enzyme
MLESIDHVNIVVRDLDRIAHLYSRVLGMKITKRVAISGPWIDQTVGLTSVHADVIYLDLQEGARLELIRYNRPAAEAPDGLGESNTPGLRHLAFRVRNIEAIVQMLKNEGIRFLSDVQLVPSSQVTYAGNAQKHLVYFQDPEGNLMELCEYK